ncbi:MAG: winged helix DNA-binding protein [Clostridia bacterium]
MNSKKIAIEILDYMLEHKPRALPPEINGEIARGEIGIMIYLYTYQNTEVFSGTLCKNLDVSSARISRALNRLEQKKLIMRNDAKSDMRLVKVELTAKGKKFVEEEKENALKKIQSIVEFLGEEDTMQLIKIKNRIDEFLKNESKN